MLFHYDGRTTEWDDEFPWSKEAIHVSARKQAKWWYAKRFLHPSVVAPYDYLFLWDEDLAADFFDADEYVRLVAKHGLRISQPGLDITRGKKTYDVTTRRNGSEVHRNTVGGPGNCSDVHQRPCSGFVEVMAPVFSRDAWACAWHMIQNDLVHGWGLDLNFWRCVDDPDGRGGRAVRRAPRRAHAGAPGQPGHGRRRRQRQSAGVARVRRLQGQNTRCRQGRCSSSGGGTMMYISSPTTKIPTGLPGGPAQAKLVKWCPWSLGGPNAAGRQAFRIKPAQAF